jgi:hypothetical protein
VILLVFLEYLILIDETGGVKQAQVNRSSFDIVDGLLYQKPKVQQINEWR